MEFDEIDDLDIIVNDSTNKEVEELRIKIKEASQKYHTNGSSGVSDSTWDSWIDRLTELSPDDPLLDTVGNGYELDLDDSDDIIKVDHPIVVGSIPKCKDPSVIKAKAGKKTTFSVKLDGNSIVAYYEYGVLDKVLTRGKNNVGIDRTNKFKTILPNKIDCPLAYVAVRGEAVIAKEDFTIENGFDIKNSSRNTVAGLISRKEDWEIPFKFIKLVVYTFIDCNTKKSVYSEYEWSKWFEVEEQKPVSIFLNMDIDDFFYDYKLNWKYDSDGTVFIFDDGSSLALKFQDETVQTGLRAIQWVVGSDQRLTPIALLNPVKLSGATIGKASLGSFDRVKQMGLWPLPVDPIVSIIRANEIIPYVTKMISNMGLSTSNSMPICPCCGSVSVLKGKHVYCVNESCPNIELSALLKFCSFFYPDGLSDKQITKVFTALKIRTIIDLLSFNYKRIDFTKYDGIGKSLALLVEVFFDKISGDIDSKIVYQAVITSCGSSIAKTIVSSGINIRDIYSTTGWINTLRSISGFNKNVIEQLIANKRTIKEICNLRNVADIRPKKIVGTYCVTGIRFSKEQIDTLSIAGWVEDNSVKKTTTVLVTNDIYGSSTKIDKAKKYGTPILEIERFFQEYIDEE